MTEIVPVEVPPVTMAVLTLTGALRPPFPDVLLVTDLLHDALAAELARERPRRADSLLLGMSAAGRPLSGHRHAFFLGLCGLDERVADILVWTPGGLAADEVTALSRIDALSLGPLRTGGPSRAPLPMRLTRLDGDDALPSPLIGPARRWRSVTPYLPTGHRKGDPETFAGRRLRADLGHMPASSGVGVDSVEVLPSPFARSFTSRRARGPTQGRYQPCPVFVEVDLDREVHGPLCVGALSHFGLGLFAAVP